jgi:5-methylcytosine-specific restriction protein B
MLKDLVDLRREAESSIDSFRGVQIEVSEKLKTVFADAYRAETKDEVIKLDSSLLVITSTGLSAYVPYEWLSRIQVCSVYIAALIEYEELISAMKSKLGKDILKQLPCINWRKQLPPSDVAKIDLFINNRFKSESDKISLNSFLEGLTWQDENRNSPRGVEGKAFDRNDYIGAAVKKSFKLISEMSSKLDKCIDAYMNHSEFRGLVVNALLKPTVIEGIDTGLIIKTGENKIFYGAPGTGKSYDIDQIVKEHKHVSTVFHPDTQYSDFVGCLKPSMNGKDVEYKFREGPFCKSLKLAHENQGEHCYLVIEEINRASAAAVFGEIFQMLDREPDGCSKYAIDINDPDMLSYLSKNASSVLYDDQLKLPSNLSIYATMNSSDQAVMPMDTAFKRRWKFKYKPIDFSNCAKGKLNIPGPEGSLVIEWKDFAECVNKILVTQDIPEDRLLGPWFLKNEELIDEAAAQALSGKLFMYLWDDVLRHGQKTALFDESIKNYGQLVDSFQRNKPVFSEVFYPMIQEIVGEDVRLIKGGNVAPSNDDMAVRVAEPSGVYTPEETEDK